MKRALSFVCIFVLLSSLSSISLKELYEQAKPENGYDKYLELETGQVYEGGLLMGKSLGMVAHEQEEEEELDVKIVGNGAILDLQGSEICISGCENILDIEDCVIINGNVRYRGYTGGDKDQLPVGKVEYVTMYKPHDYGIRLCRTGEGITLRRNLVIEAVNTGNDFNYTNGISLELLPTGHNYSISIQEAFCGFPLAEENWSYRFKDSAGVDSLAHFSMLCEYG